jgi:hypothetical protein
MQIASQQIQTNQPTTPKSKPLKNIIRPPTKKTKTYFLIFVSTKTMPRERVENTHTIPENKKVKVAIIG